MKELTNQITVLVETRRAAVSIYEALFVGSPRPDHDGLLSLSEILDGVLTNFGSGTTEHVLGVLRGTVLSELSAVAALLGAQRAIVALQFRESISRLFACGRYLRKWSEVIVGDASASAGSSGSSMPPGWVRASNTLPALYSLMLLTLQRHTSKANLYFHSVLDATAQPMSIEKCKSYNRSIPNQAAVCEPAKRGKEAQITGESRSHVQGLRTASVAEHERKKLQHQQQEEDDDNRHRDQVRQQQENRKQQKLREEGRDFFTSWLDDFARRSKVLAG